MLRDKRLSNDALAALVRILSYPEAWTFTFKWLQSTARVGKNKAYAIIAELEALGYCRRDMVRDASGRIAGTIHVFTDECEPSPGNGEMDKKDNHRFPPIREPASREPVPAHTKDLGKGKDSRTSKNNIKSCPTSLTEQEAPRKSAVGQLDEIDLKGKGRKAAIPPDLIERAELIGMDSAAIETEAHTVWAHRPAKGFTTICHTLIGERLPGLQVGVIAAAMAGEPKALARVAASWREAGAIR
jgi:hypothetical protein